MKRPWFYAETIGPPGEILELDPEEARHAGKAARLRPGDQAVISDGQGQTATMEIQESARGRIVGRIEKTTLWPRTRPALHLASALPKGDRLATLLSMATQIGLHSFTPLQCERSVVPAPEAIPDRWPRIVREAAKQSHQAWLPELRASQPLAAYAEHMKGAAQRIQLDPSGVPWPTRGPEAAGATPEAIALLVGPEGGFTEAETEALQRQGVVTRALHTGILRIETAAVVGLSALTLNRVPLETETGSPD